MAETIKVYPLRTTRKNWVIPLVSIHECNSKCTITIKKVTENSETFFYVINNPLYDGEKCNLKGKLQKTIINIDSFDYNNPKSFIGPLYNSDNIVIPDKEIHLKLSFPLSRIINITIKSPDENGFTLKVLLNIIKNVYQYIYSEEERTSTVREFTYEKRCDVCLIDKHISNYLIPVSSQKECCICCNIKEKESLKLPCNHTFHKKCINKWIENSLTCPLCRENIIDCDKCNGRGMITYNYTGSVIPRENRGIFMNRNVTDGIFGIYGYDLEDLHINGLFYDNVEKILHLDINV